MRNGISLLQIFLHFSILVYLSSCALAVLPPLATATPAELQNDFGAGAVAINTGIASELLFFQTAYNTNAANGGGSVSANVVANLYSMGFFVDPNDGNRLKWIITDRANNRVLIYNNVPNAPSVLPDVVVGQTDFSSNGQNAGQGATVNAYGFSSNTHVSVSTTGQMFVCDRTNNRVLVYNKIPQVSGAAADLVIGQSTFATGTSGASATTLNLPYAAYVIGKVLFIADKANNRILGFKSVPVTNGAAADFVIGQPDLVTVASTCTASGLSQPYDFNFNNGVFYVADGNNHRVLAYPALPSANSATAFAALGQPSLTNCAINQGGSVSATSLYFPEGLAIKGNYLAVADNFNNRILAYQMPVVTNQAAAFVIGQTNFTTNGSSSAADHFYGPRSLTFDGQFVWVADSTNSRAQRLANSQF